jgi:hypothetical protein
VAKKKAKAKKTAGRPSKYDERFVEEAEKLTMLGLTDKQLADFWGISVSTMFNWRDQHPAFLEALKAGKCVADGAVAQSLFKRATGYSHPAVKILQSDGQPLVVPYTERYPPDATSMIFWLKNRRPDLWRDKSEVTNKTQPGDDAPTQTALQLAREIAFALSVAMRSAEATTSTPDTPVTH